MAFLKNTAQNLMDLYYQNYKSDEDFFKKHHFKYIAAVAYNALLQSYYDDSYRRNLAENGRGDVDLNQDWFITEEVEIKNEHGLFVGSFKNKPYAFMHDNQYRSISTIIPLTQTTGCIVKLARIDEKIVWQLSSLPKTAYTFWYLLGGKLRFANVRCGVGKVLVYLIPALMDTEDDRVIADALEAPVIQAALNMMFTARQGTVVDMTNNQNPNKAMETEIDTVFRGLKTKP
jgi:hypothetical protein